jgi:hypothetical protein
MQQGVVFIVDWCSNAVQSDDIIYAVKCLTRDVRLWRSPV